MLAGKVASSTASSAAPFPNGIAVARIIDRAEEVRHAFGESSSHQLDGIGRVHDDLKNKNRDEGGGLDGGNGWEG